MGISKLSCALVDKYVGLEIIHRTRTDDKEFVRAVIRSGAMVGSHIEQFKHLNRGMDHAAQLITDFENQDISFPSGLVICARQLSGGQGRFERYWHAPDGGLWMTVVLVNTLLPESVRLLPLAIGVACCEAVRQYAPAAHLKWVNDVHVANYKVAGILAKTMLGPRHGEEYITIGLGVNVNNDEFPPELTNMAQSLKKLHGADIDLDEFAGLLIAKLVWNIGLLNACENIRLQEAFDLGSGGHPIVNAWQKLSDTVGRRVLFGHNVQEKPQYEAIVKKIMADGALVLELVDSGDEVIENSGELLYLD